MPYLRPIPKEERHQLLENGEIKNALQNFAKSGYLHGDVKWRHLGRSRGKDAKDQEKNQTIFLLDLGSILKEGDEAKQNAWVDEAVDHLRGSAGNPVLKVTPKELNRKRRLGSTPELQPAYSQKQK